MKRALFIFRRDLRSEDNTGLLFALKNAKEVILSFIFTPEQIDLNSYRSDHCLQFMIESLEDLEKEIQSQKGKFYLFFGKPEEVVAQCIEKLSVDGVVVNRDYTPYSIQRDQKIQFTCETHQVPFYSFNDALLHPIEDTLKSNGEPYVVFTPFYRNASRLEVQMPLYSSSLNYYTKPISFAKTCSLFEKILPHRGIQQKGGRKAAHKILKSLSDFSDYSFSRDFPAKNGTTHLSPHLKFTTFSIREIYHLIVNQFGFDCELIRSLYWREFFTLIAFHYPSIFTGPFKSKFQEIEWNQDEQLFKLWCEGRTGFPIVDAGMREMNQTGFMHNRVRMIAASFLVKDLHIDWRWGEKYFAQTLIDYDPAINNGNWQWIASTGCDAQPYFRIFNPWQQTIKYDPDCLYIKHWIPELANLSSNTIHKWHMEKYRITSCYPAPIINHEKEAKTALNMYRK